MTSGTVSSLLVLLLSCSRALAQQQAQFNQVLNIGGDMSLNSFQFQDGSRVETRSQKQQQLIVNQQTPSISANQVTGSTGNPFVALQQTSMVISTNGATDLVGAQIEMAMPVAALQQAQIDPGNTFVAMLSPDRQTWMIQESIRSINTTDMTVRMVKLQTIDGEYMMVGRQTAGTETQLTPFGSNQAAQVSITGTGLQENEFQDGFRMSIKATQPMTMNVDTKKGIDSSMLTALQGQVSVNDYRYSVTTSLAGVQSKLNQQVTVIQMPLNAQRIQTMMKAAGIQPGGQVSLGVAQRKVLGNPGGATNIAPAQLAPQKRGRDAFRSALARRQTDSTTGQTGQTGQTQVDPTTGQPIQQGTAGTTQQIDPTTGQPIQQGTTGQQIDPTTGQPIQQGTGQQTGQTQQGTPTTGNNPVATQLLLEPTFTPVQANLVLDTVNMRVAFPVSQLDGEYILTMQTGGAAAAAPAAAAPAPAAEAPKPGAANGTAPAEPKIKRQDAPADTNPAKGQVFITMREVDRMVETAMYGGQAPISKMMSEYVKANNGTASA
ncbi:hypothetical protein DPSP01_011273 [Paraphaeosphaeria sporulosa]|uniref:Uncharacterized protein n=1 Tax=Paraphaeosphaeria sporulosa TaxID=1460663 RepID=A0A177BWT4_9PLEO|nr:uncharacterized protein CC84DRAFT_1181088 [Paraphaeosphaeria sporulosa]OAF99595.1 hypothetical protein CC84DRAFT_1181088 [Paraphaeosphaeria sporulosa]